MGQRSDSLTPFRRRAHWRRTVRRLRRPALVLLVLLAVGAGVALWHQQGAARAIPQAAPPAPTGAPTPAPVQAVHVAPVRTPAPATAPLPPTRAPTLAPPAAETAVVDQVAARPAAPLVLLVDGSNSMHAPLGSATRIAAARAVLAEVLATLPVTQPVQLWAYGLAGSTAPADQAASCVAGQPLTDLTTPEHLHAPLQALTPRGWTPLAATLHAVAAAYPSGPLTVVVLTDGVETCGGDPPAAAAQLHAGRADRQVLVVALAVEPGEQAALQALAQAGGGALLPAQEAAELRQRLLGASVMPGDARARAASYDPFIVRMQHKEGL